MESDSANGFKRNSSQQNIYSRPVERRPSKKSSSRDRHGMVYPDSFRDTGIRTVTPESTSDTGNQSPASDAEYLAGSGATSPRSVARLQMADSSQQQQQQQQRRRDPASSYNSTGDEADLQQSELKGQRTRSRTTTLEDQRSEILSPFSYPPVAKKNRNRLDTIDIPRPDPKLSGDSIGSIGFPSIQSPTFYGLSSGAHRLSKTSLHPAVIEKQASSIVSPLVNMDASKILQLMKATCGRMHGILSFRAASPTAAWTSGYCAINVATGSLIYQAKGEPALAKTLIPDLRGCHVRTLFDPDLQIAYLNVTTFTSGLGIHLRPHVSETFDSWLAALLCWQPIRPKGVQNKMTKPQSVVIGERRLADRRRNSESTVQKDAAIIKVGKMLLWDKPTASGARPDTSRRVSTYRQQRALSSSWQKVSCTLQENGHFKLFTDSDVSLINCIQLSQLSRCAVQQLESSVLEDEFCIAIYPQYAAHGVPESPSRPLYLALETRVLFEVWFVLLRAFTIPELYGPEVSTTAPTAAAASPPAAPAAAAAAIESSTGKTQPQNILDAEEPTTPVMAATGDMFRIERTISVRITEAKVSRIKEEAPRVRKQSRSHGQPLSPMSHSDYYAEVLLDGEIRAKTTVKYRTGNPFWREDFTFNDLPPVLSQVSVLVKVLSPVHRDWSLIAHGSYKANQDAHSFHASDGGSGSGSGNGGSSGLENASQDATLGRVDLRLDDLEPGVDDEKWWPILDEQDQSVGEMYMKVRMEETVVLMSHEYEPMSELLHSFNNNLTIIIAQILSSELNQLSETLLNIYQVSGQAVEWISSLIEDEIDGVHKESTANRLRYTTRIHSNDSKDTVNQDREVLVRDLGRTATVEANLLFRGNSLLTKALDMHMRRLGKDYLEDTIGQRIRDIDESDPECEVDPSRVQRSEDLERNWRNLVALTTGMWKAIAGSASRCPPELRLIFRHVRACAEDRYGDFLRTVTYSSVSGFLFLRFFCPAILNPKLFALLKDHPRPRAQRTLTLIAKALQGLANMTTFGNKEPWMEPMNKFLISNRSDFRQYVDAICNIPADRPAPMVSPSYATPIQILGRLPPTSREGFPSLPFLIDHARSFASLTNLWLEASKEKLAEIEEVDPVVHKFNEIAQGLHERTKECMGRAEQAERPSGSLEIKWEELVDSMERSATFYDESSSKPTTPSTETAIAAGSSTSVTTASHHRNSIGYFSPRPTLARRSTDLGPDPELDTPPSSSSANWDQNRVAFSVPKWSGGGGGNGTGAGAGGYAADAHTRDSTGSSKNSSTYSLEYTDTSSKGRRSSMTRETASKYRFFDFVPAPSRRKTKERDQTHQQQQQQPREELRNEI